MKMKFLILFSIVALIAADPPPAVFSLVREGASCEVAGGWLGDGESFTAQDCANAC
jgi:hypothetical protein